MCHKAKIAGLAVLLALAGPLAAQPEDGRVEATPLDALRTFAEVFGRIKEDYVGPVEDRKLLEVLGLPLTGRHRAQLPLVAASLALDDGVEHLVEAPIELGQPRLLGRTLNHHVVPVLAVGTGWRLQGELKQRQQHLMRYRFEVQTPHRTLSAHRILHRHAEPGKRLGRRGRHERLLVCCLAHNPMVGGGSHG